MAEYCALGDVKARMPELGSGDDGVVGDLILAVSEYFDSETGRTFGAESAVRTFSGTGSTKLFMRPPLTAAPTLVRVRTTTSDTWRTVPTADIRLMPEGRQTGDPVLWLELGFTPTGTDYIWPESDQTVEVTGTWGRSAVPADLKEAAIQTVVNLYRSRGSAGLDELGTGGAFMPMIPKAIPAFAYRVIQNYKRLVYA